MIIFYLFIENKKNLQVDEWREDQLIKSLCREGHPIKKFGTGIKC